MQSWQGTYIGVREVPREVGELELQAFFTFSRTEHAIIQRRRALALKLGLALHMGFVRMSGRPLDAFRVLPVVLSYAAGERTLPADKPESAEGLGRVWSAELGSSDRERAFRALEVATLFAWRRAVRNGSVWLEHSLSFRGRDRLFLPPERWQAEAPRHYARLSLPTQATDFLPPLLERMRVGVDAVATAARAGTLRVRR